MGQNINKTSVVIKNESNIKPFFSSEDGHLISELCYSSNNLTTAHMSRGHQKEFSFNIPAGETRFIRSTFPPFSSVKKFAEKNGGQVSIESFGLHNTTTIDFAIVKKGKVNLIIENETIQINAGDCIVQQATIYGWVNPTEEVSEMVFVMVGVRVEENYKQKNFAPTNLFTHNLSP